MAPAYTDDRTRDFFRCQPSVLGGSIANSNAAICHAIGEAGSVSFRRDLMTSQPSGMVAFLLTDIEGSSRLWEVHPVQMRRALAEHDRLLRQAISTNHGHVFATAGDSLAAAFHEAGDAVQAAVEAQAAIVDLVAGGESVRVRMAVHAGEAEERAGDYFGQVLNRCGRLRDAAHGGQIVISRAVQELLPTKTRDEVRLVDLGEHRLRDLETPEWVFQVAHPELHDPFPPLRTLTKASTNFPVQLTSFVGRDQELEEVAKLVRGSRLVTLTGVGGSGKTRLAMHAAAVVAPDFPDGVWLVDLAPISEPGLVLHQVASVFGVRERVDRSLLHGVVEHVKTHKYLMVLDNCEHLIEESSRIAFSLLGGSEGLRILATSREALHLPNEVVYLVPPLGVPVAGYPKDPRLAASFDSVRLFASRAENVQPGFRLDEETSAAAMEICRRLDGIPLAIELAAARLASFTPRQIASHLDQRFRLLSGGRRGGLVRQETLEATINWSYALLTDIERLVFMRLAVFRGGFSLEAAQRILAGGAIDELGMLEVLPRLIDKSLVVSEPLQGEMRYRLLETLRQYADDRWDSTGERPAFEGRHATYFLALAEEGADNLRSAKHQEVFERLQTEHDNMRQALRWSLESAEIETGLRLAGALYRFWLYNDSPSEGVWWLETLLSRGGVVADAVRAKALLGFGSLAGQLIGRARAGIAALKQAVEIYRSLPDQEGTRLDYATALNNLGSDLVATGDYAEAEACFEQALEASQALGIDWGVAIVLTNLGSVAAWGGRLEEARRRFEGAVHQARQLGSHRLIGDAQG
ncbi:MAG: ATP-binding protein, partial [Acidimicrobiia bacterium]